MDGRSQAATMPRVVRRDSSGDCDEEGCQNTLSFRLRERERERDRAVPSRAVPIADEPQPLWRASDFGASLVGSVSATASVPPQLRT